MGARHALIGGVAALVLAMPAPAAGALAPAPAPPDVTGMNRSVAEETLRDWRPDVELTHLPDLAQLPPRADPDRAVVVRQSLNNPKWEAAGEPPRVNLTLAARVPPVVGMLLEKAGPLMEEHGLRFATEPRFPTGEWVVAAQRPAALARAEFGSTVLLALRRPPPVDPGVVVPDLGGLSVDEARQAVESAGLALDLVTLGPTDGTPGAVREQSPAAGTVVPRGSRVSATVQLRPSPGVGIVPPPDPGPRLTTVQAVGLGAGFLVALLLLLLGGWSMLRRRAPSRPGEQVPIEAVSVRPYPGRVAGPTVRDIGGTPSIGVRLEPHPDPGVQTLSEVGS